MLETPNLKISLSKAKEFAEAILSCDEYLEFTAANLQLKEDTELQKLMDSFESKQADIYSDKFTPQLMDEIKIIREAINSHSVVQRYIKAQSAFIELLKRTDVIISGRIGRQFSTTQNGGCGCGC